MAQVRKVLPYRDRQGNSVHSRSYMLIRQYEFPSEMRNDEPFVSDSTDRLLAINSKHVRHCFRRHAGGEDHIFESWSREAYPASVFRFMTDILSVPSIVGWTGFRILVRSDSQQRRVWTFELFKKFPESGTKVYSDERAPNILRN